MTGERVFRILVAVCVAMAALYLVGLYTKHRDCEASGGVLVRGVGGHLCITRDAVIFGTDGGRGDG